MDNDKSLWIVYLICMCGLSFFLGFILGEEDGKDNQALHNERLESIYEKYLKKCRKSEIDLVIENSECQAKLLFCGKE